MEIGERGSIYFANKQIKILSGKIGEMQFLIINIMV